MTDVMRAASYQLSAKEVFELMLMLPHRKICRKSRSWLCFVLAGNLGRKVWVRFEYTDREWWEL